VEEAEIGERNHLSTLEYGAADRTRRSVQNSAVSVAPQLIITVPEPSVLTLMASLATVGIGVLTRHERKWLREAMRKCVLRNEKMAS